MAMKLPYAEVEFDDKGARVHPEQMDAARALIAEKDATDVIVISHGWNNTAAQARALYEQLVDSIVAVAARVDGAGDRRLVVVGVVWPSIQWAPDDNAGAGAGVDDDAAMLEAEIAERIDDPATAKKLQALVPRLDASPAAQQQFVTLLRSTLPKTTKGEDEAAFEALKTESPAAVLDAARGADDDDDPHAAVRGADAIDPMGPGATIGGGGAGLFDSIIGAARNLVNVATYYTMKERAGGVGHNGIAPLLDDLHEAAPDVRLHLVGHSFGGRAVTAAAVAASAPVASLSLLQAAYSHFGMAKGWDGASANGLFIEAPKHVTGPVIVTHTKNDKAVGMAYPIASRLARQIGAGLGDENDPYGGIGRNGALKTPGNVMATLLDVGGTYDFTGDQVWSLNADAFVTGHSDITGRQVAYAVLSAVVAGG